MEKEFRYISNNNIIFLILMGLGLFPTLLSTVFLAFEEYLPWNVLFVSVAWLIWFVILWLCWYTSYLKCQFKADENACDFVFFRGNLHLCYEDIKEISFFNVPKHSRYGSLIAYEIQLRITDKEDNEHVIRQRVSMEYSSFDYPQGLPEEVQNAELTQIGNFLKEKMNPDIPETPQKTEKQVPSAPLPTADSPEMKEIQKRISEKEYIQNIEIRKTYDFVENMYQTNLLLTLTDDNTFCDDDTLKIRFEHISNLNLQDVEAMVHSQLMIYDYYNRAYEAGNRFELADEENSILSFYFEKAEITS